jgi:uncharacterized protein YkwD
MRLRTPRLSFALVLMLLVCSFPVAPGLVGAAPGDGADGADAGGGAVAAVPMTIVELTNAERARAGLAALKANARLMQAAQLQAEQLASTGKLSHVLNNGPYPAPQDRLAAVGYRWRAFGENIAYGHPDPEAATRGWMQSPGHRTNILNAAYSEIGTAYVLDSRGRPYFVQVFGKPRS